MPVEPDEFSYELRVPRERVAVLIGKEGAAKKMLEQATKTEIRVDSEEGDVTIIGKDPLALYTAREIVRAIGRGFKPDTALLLLKQDYALEVVDITRYARSKEDMDRLRGRVIGEEGKARRVIEELTGCFISVFGKTIATIGRYEELNLARRAVESLLSGNAHKTVYRWLERQRRELRRLELTPREKMKERK